MPEPAKKNVFDDIALAHREIYALYEIAQAMGTSLGVSDTMALIAAKLSNLVPFSCAALFLYDEETDTLRCRFATGTDADVIQQIAVRSGEGLTGWVARNRRPLVNARPSADFEAAGLVTRYESAVSARLPAALRRASSSARCPSITSIRPSTATITAGCSIASPSRRPRSSTTRCCSSRRSPTR